MDGAERQRNERPDRRAELPTEYIEERKMAANEVDIVGIVLYMLFLLLVCWRVKPFFVEERLSSTDKIKLGFHTCLLGSSLLELGELCLYLLCRVVVA